MTTVTNYPSSNSVYQTGLTNPNNAHADDGVYATCSPASGSTVSTDYSGFGFSIPTGAIIDSVKVIYEYKISSNSNTNEARVTYIPAGGTRSAELVDSSEPTTNSTITVDITSARSWTVADFGSGLTVSLGGYRSGGSNLSGDSNVIDYITIATTGNATDFGDLSVARRYVTGVSSSTRGCFGGGFTTSVVIDYITIATTGNALSFGSLTVGRYFTGGVSSGTRGCFGGGSSSNVIDYITIATTGSATDFGDLTVARDFVAGVSSSTRGCFGGGYLTTSVNSNVIDYITIATTGNATDFGDLSVARRYLGGVSSNTRGCFGGGYDVSYSNVIDYITIATTGNATDFGDLTVARQAVTGVQGS